MKKITAYILGIGLLAAACNPMEDIYNDLDQMEDPYQENVEITLSDDDYASFDGEVADNHYFTAEEPANDFIPTLLAEKYPAFDYGSAVQVTYNFSTGYPDLSAYTDAGYYSLTEEDYDKVNDVVGTSNYFTPENPADEYVPAILADAVSDAENGDIYIVSYMYSDVEPEIEAPQEIAVFDFEFENGLGDFTTVNVLGDEQDWYHSSYQGMGYAKMSGFSGAAIPNEDWLISPEIDLSGVSNATVNINQAINYVGGEWDQVTILVSSDYSGSNDPSAANWTEITPVNMPTGDNWTFVESGKTDISDFDGETIHIAFKYISSDSNAATWEVNKVTVTGMGLASKSAAIITEPVKMEELYVYDSGWEKMESAYYVKVVDYNAMGEPGRYDNFSSSANPDNYLPQLLEQKFPYAQEGDEMVVVYKYYSGGVQTRADEYHFMNGTWTEFDPVETKTDQFILTRNDGWVFDPTVSFTMSSDDYQTIVDWVKANKGDDMVDSYGTQEYYFSAGSYYSNYDIREGNWDSSVFSSWQDAVKASISNVLLPAKFPNAVAQVSGIDVLYKVTFATYDGTAGEYTYIFQCIKSGPNPEFEFVGEEE